MKTTFDICGSAKKDPLPGTSRRVRDVPDSAPAAQVRHVLVVDDEPDLADLAEALLATYGFEVTVAYSATDALRILQRDDDIDAVFSDIMMPEMTGLQLARVVAELIPRIRIVLTSGYTPPALLTEHDERFPFIAKPYRMEKVVALLRG